MPIEPLSPAELLELRDAYILDRVDLTSNPKVYLSHYNRATSAQLFSDTALQSMNSAVENDQREELDRVREAKRVERIRHQDSEADAATAAEAMRKEAKFRLIRSRTRRLMLADPGFTGSIADGRTRVALMEEWRAQIVEDENFARGRQGGMAGVRFLRR